MVKATLTFELPEELDELKQALLAGSYSGALWDISQELRRRTKYAPEDMPADTLAALEDMYAFVSTAMTEAGYEEW